MRVSLQYSFWHDFLVHKDNVPVSYPGVYMLLHVPSDRCYVGSSFDVRRRLADHAQVAKKTGGYASAITKALRELGTGSFLVSPLYYLFDLRQAKASEYLQEVEMLCIRALDCIDNGFNRREGTLRAAWQDQRFRELVAASRKTPEALATRAAVFGSEEFKAKISVSSRETWSDPERRERAREASNAIWSDPVRRATQAAKQRAHLATPEGKARRRAQATEVNGRPEVRERHRQRVSALVWITNGAQTKRITIVEPLPAGWRKGRTISTGD